MEVSALHLGSDTGLMRVHFPVARKAFNKTIPDFVLAIFLKGGSTPALQSSNE
jgi:hypothetical protein